jgi:methyl-accepting chemotaxis protein
MKRMNLRTKMILALGAIIVAGFAAVIVGITLATRSVALELVYDRSVASAAKEGSGGTARFTRMVAVAEDVASMLGAAVSARAAPQLIVGQLESVIDARGEIGGVWAVFEESVYASLPASTPGRAPDGRFAPYWNRLGGTKHFEYCVDYDADGPNGLYYRKPLETGKPFFTEPTTYQIAGKPTTVLSFCMPVRAGGKVVGVAGVDVSVEVVAQDILSIKPFKTGYAYLVSGAGNFIVHPLSDLVGKNIGDYVDPARKDELLKAISTGTIFTETKANLETGELSYVVTTPISLGSEGQFWGFGLVTPLDTLLAPVARLLFIALGIAAVSIAAFIGALFPLVGAVTKPIRLAAGSFREIAVGEADLTRRIEVKRSDEIGDLVNDFNTFVAKLHDIVANLKAAQAELGGIGDELVGSVGETAGAISQIDSSLARVRERARNQSASVEESSSAVAQIARNIEALEGLISDQAASVTEASASIEEMVGNIGAVSSSIEKMAEQFVSLASASESGRSMQAVVADRVAQIAERSRSLLEANEVIAAIASQTNLLAMNAAIEAAHAGEAGKGFSVVADEIRRLAETSAEQSRSIGGELKGVQEAIDAVVDSSRESEESFGLVASRISETDTLVREVRLAMAEQREGSAQILEALKAMNDITTQVRSGSAEMSSGNRTILDEMTRLRETSADIARSIDEMAKGSAGIQESARKVSKMAEATRGTIAAMDESIGRFRV